MAPNRLHSDCHLPGNKPGPDRPALPGSEEKPMSQRNTKSIWHRLALGSLVLLVTSAAFCTVAASASARDRGPAAALGSPAP